MSVKMSKTDEEYEEQSQQKHTQIHVFSTAPIEPSKTLPQYMAATAGSHQRCTGVVSGAADLLRHPVRVRYWAICNIQNSGGALRGNPHRVCCCLFLRARITLLSSGEGKRREAISSLQWLRGQSPESVQTELDIIQNEMDEIRQRKSQLRDLWSTKGNIKALCLSLGLVACQQLSGIDAVLFNAQTIFTSTGSTLNAAVATILVGVVMFIASGCTPLVVERFGRRFLLLLSGIGMAVSLGVLGAFLSYQGSGADISSIGWLPVALLLIYIIVYSIGFGPLPWAVLGELFPSNVKSNASALTASFCWTICFFITLFYGDLDRLLGTHWAFWIFGIFCCLASGFVYLLLPETKGKSLQEIQDMLNR